MKTTKDHLQPGDIVEIVDGRNFRFGREHIGQTVRITSVPGALDADSGYYGVSGVDMRFSREHLRLIARRPGILERVSRAIAALFRRGDGK